MTGCRFTIFAGCSKCCPDAIVCRRRSGIAGSGAEVRAAGAGVEVEGVLKEGRGSAFDLQPPANTTRCCITGVIHYVVKSMLCSAKYFHSEKSMQNGLIERSFVKHVTKYVREWQRRQQQQGPDRAMGRSQTGFAIFRPDIRNAGQNIPEGARMTTRPPQK